MILKFFSINLFQSFFKLKTETLFNFKIKIFFNLQIIEFDKIQKLF